MEKGRDNGLGGTMNAIVTRVSGIHWESFPNMLDKIDAAIWIYVHEQFGIDFT